VIRPAELNQASFRIDLAARLRIVTAVCAQVSIRSRTRHEVGGTVLGEGGGATPHPIWVGDRKDMA